MRRAFIALAVVALAGLAAGGALAISRPARLLAARSPAGAFRRLANCAVRAAPAAAAAAEARLVEPPTVTVATAAQREFVDRLFVSGHARRARGGASRGAHRRSGDRRTRRRGRRHGRGGPGSRPARPQPARRAARAERRRDRARRRRDRSGAKPDRTVRGAARLGERRLRARAQARRQVMAAAAIEQREDRAQDRRAQLAAAQERARARRGRPQEPRRRAPRIAGAHRPHGGQGAGRRPRQPPLGAGSARRHPASASRSSASSRTARSISRPTCPSSRWRVSPSACRPSCACPASETPVDGVIRLVNKEVDKASRTGKVRIALTDGPRGRASARSPPAKSPIARGEGVGVPATAVQRDGVGAACSSSRRSVVEHRKVKVGIAEGEAVQIATASGRARAVVARAAAFLRAGRPRAPVDAHGRRSTREPRNETERLRVVDPPPDSRHRVLRRADAARNRQLPQMAVDEVPQYRHPDRLGHDHPVGRGAFRAGDAGDQEGRGRRRQPQRRLAHRLDCDRRRPR